MTSRDVLNVNRRVRGEEQQRVFLQGMKLSKTFVKTRTSASNFLFTSRLSFSLDAHRKQK